MWNSTGRKNSKDRKETPLVIRNILSALVTEFGNTGSSATQRGKSVTFLGESVWNDLGV